MSSPSKWNLMSTGPSTWIFAEIVMFGMGPIQPGALIVSGSNVISTPVTVPTGVPLIIGTPVTTTTCTPSILPVIVVNSAEIQQVPTGADGSFTYHQELSGFRPMT